MGTFDRIRAFFSNSELPQAGRFQGLNYRLVRPDRPTENAPLIVYLHGAGGAGDDNLAQLKRGSGYAISRLKESVGPSFILAPQCPRNQAWWSPSEQPSRFGEAVLGVIETLLESESIDPHRVSLVGVSMGGHGVWDLGWRYPDRWAASCPFVEPFRRTVSVDCAELRSGAFTAKRIETCRWREVARLFVNWKALVLP